MDFKKGSVVTIKFESDKASNVFVIADILGESALLHHPIYPHAYVLHNLSDLNQVGSNLKDSSERSLDYANQNRKYLDYNAQQDLDSLCLVFAIRRKLTANNKQILSNLCGKIACVVFDDDLKETLEFVKDNKGVLDEFNKIWYSNFKEFFSGSKFVTGKRQRSSIFNMAGFILAELNSPSIEKR